MAASLARLRLPIQLEPRKFNRHSGSRQPPCDTPRCRPASTRRTHNFVRDSRGIMTGLLQSNVSSVKCGAVHEFGMAGAVKFPGLVKSPGLVVEPADPGQRRQYRGLVRAVPPAP